MHHALQKGIIHRDLKPTNMLIAVADDRRVTKVIDFGVAKATREPLTEALRPAQNPELRIVFSTPAV